MKRNITIFIIGVTLFTWSVNLYSQTVPSLFCGQNAWMPDSVGAKPYFGVLKTNWSNVGNSNVKLIRYGGVACDSFLSYDRQFIRIIDSSRNHGIEPIIQVPATPGLLFDSIMAGGLVKRLNITYGLKIKYWIIGNEPDRYSIGKNTATYIHNYIIQYATAMKNRDSSIKIIGPELSYFNSHNTSDPNYMRMDSLTNTTFATSIVGTIGSGHGSGKAFIDYLSWHDYPFDGSVAAKSLKTIERQLTHVDSANFGWMRRKCNTLNASRGSYPLNPVITEANLNYFSNGNPPDNTWNGKKTNSFLAGQYWTQMMAVGINRGLSWINFWSVIEGSDLCYINSSGTKKPTYQHMLEFGKYYDASATSTSANINYLGTTNDSNLKAFGVYNSNQIAIFVLNMDSNKNTQKFYNIRTDNTSQIGTWAKVDMGLHGSSPYYDSIYGQSSTVIVYDCGANVSKKYRYELRDSLNPWKSVWAASSPATLYTVSAGADKVTNPGCVYTFTATSSPNTGTHTYLWYKNGISTGVVTYTYSISGSAGQTFTVEVVMTTNGCTAKDDALFSVNHGASCNGSGGRIKFEEAMATQELVPNPTSNSVSIYYTLANENSNAEIILRNIYGQSVGKYVLNPKEEKTDIDCSSLGNGIYFSTLLLNGQPVSTKKLMIVK